MTHKFGGQYSMECDECGCEYTFGSDFMDMIEEAKKAGWKILPDGDGWKHFCPDCAEAA
jgi:hypothetical protein